MAELGPGSKSSQERYTQLRNAVDELIGMDHYEAQQVVLDRETLINDAFISEFAEGIALRPDLSTYQSAAVFLNDLTGVNGAEAQQEAFKHAPKTQDQSAEFASSIDRRLVLFKSKEPTEVEVFDEPQTQSKFWKSNTQVKAEQDKAIADTLSKLTTNDGLPPENIMVEKQKDITKFAVPYSPDALRKLNDVKNKTKGRIFGFNDSYMYMWVGLSTMNMAAFSPVLAGVLFGSVALVTTGSSLLAQKMRRKIYAPILSVREKVQLESRRVFRSWLEERHQLMVSESELDRLSPAYMGEMKAGRMMKFTDAVKGEKYRLVMGQDSYTMEVTPDGKADSVRVLESQSRLQEQAIALKQKEDNQVAVQETLEELPTALADMYTQILEGVARLRQYSLVVETSHAVQRIEDDAQQAVLAYKRILLLDPNEKDSDFTEQVFTWLLAELADITKSEVQSIRSQIEVHNRYVSARNANSGLKLVERSEGSEAKEVS
jgi:hypothetical protein